MRLILKECDNSTVSPTALDLSPIILPNQTRTSHGLYDCEIAVLQEQGFPLGLAKTLNENNEVFPLRIWLVDNSLSMRNLDSHKISEDSSSNYIEQVKGSRWSEIQQVVEYHSQMAPLLRAPTIFRLLNKPRGSTDPQQFSIGENGTTTIDNELHTALRTIGSVIPYGPSLLTEHIREIRENIEPHVSVLTRDGTKVVIILATNGLPTDVHGDCDDCTKWEFIETLRSLKDLPVCVVIRLCTDDSNVVKFYNFLNQKLELSLEILDDFSQEAKEVYTHNPWLNYALPLHRCREMGCYHPLFVSLDDRRIEIDELREFFIILFGAEHFDSVPNPRKDWKGFLNSVSRIMKTENDQWNPVTKRLSPWVDVEILDKFYK